MSYINQARINKENAEKARVFDQQQQAAREGKVYDLGRTDGNTEAYGAVQQELQRRLQERAAQQRLGVSQGLANWFNG